MILMMSLMMGTMGFTQAFACVEDFRKANISAAKILQITESKPTFDRCAGPDIGKLEGKIEFKNVGFKYATRSEWAVKDLSFTIEAGETVAFVGESGCGKTTTLALLQRLYEIDEGQILIDGKNIAEFSPASVRKNISIVPQSPVLYTMSVRENIAYSKPDATDAEIADAATIGNAHNFIMQLNNNYKSLSSRRPFQAGRSSAYAFPGQSLHTLQSSSSSTRPQQHSTQNQSNLSSSRLRRSAKESPPSSLRTDLPRLKTLTEYSYLLL